MPLTVMQLEAEERESQMRSIEADRRYAETVKAEMGYQQHYNDHERRREEEEGYKYALSLEAEEESQALIRKMMIEGTYACCVYFDVV
jgi:hypothetical protein